MAQSMKYTHITPPQNCKMKSEELINLILEILQTHNEGRHSISQYVQEMVIKMQNQMMESKKDDEEDSKLISSKEDVVKNTITKKAATNFGLTLEEKEQIQAICCGVKQHSALLDDSVGMLYSLNTQLRPSSKLLYKVYFYYIIFELQQHSFKILKKLLNTQPPPVILPLLRTVWQDCDLHKEAETINNSQSQLAATAKKQVIESHLSEEFQIILSRYFDDTYINNVLTNSIVIQNLKHAQQHIHELSQMFESDEKPDQFKATKKQTTEIHEFNITRPKLETENLDFVEKEELIKQVQFDEKMFEKTTQEVLEERTHQIKEKSKPITIPDTKLDRLAKPKVNHQNEESNQQYTQNQQQAQKQQQQQQSKQQTQSQLKQAQQQSQLKLQHQSQQLPILNQKLNKNQILKENALLEKQILKQAQEMREYEFGLRDSSEFERWKIQMQAQDRAEEEAKVEIRKIQIKNAKSQMNGVVTQMQNEKAKLTQQQQAQNLQIMIELMEKEEVELNAKKQNNLLFQQQLQEQVKLAQQQLLNEKQNISKEVNENLKQKLNEQKNIKEIEMVEKQNYIKQIKAILEVTTAKRVEQMENRFDPSKQKDWGFLDQMSLSELKERIVQMKEFQIQLIQRKRDEIELQRQKDEEELQRKHDRLVQIKQQIGNSLQNQRIGDSVYQNIVDQVKQFTNQKIEEFKLEQQKQEEQNKEFLKQSELQQKDTKQTVNDLKTRLKQLQEKNSTTKAFGTQKMEKTETSKIEAAKRNASQFNALQKQNATQKINIMETEFKQKQQDALHDEKLQQQRRAVHVQHQNQLKQQKKEIDTLKDPYKAKVFRGFLDTQNTQYSQKEE